MSEFTPTWPRSISGHDYRLPLDDEQLEAIAKRLNAIYRKHDLSDESRGLLLKVYSDLVQLDGVKKEPHPHRPWRGEGTMGNCEAHNQRWIEWLLETLDRMEAGV
ncbi:hypothetical protein [Brucella grignonensis]|uniref:Uncharacterized protein n=1 Tax=Brucella grignonensis TaxID=94627 RepID=A0A256F2Z7_9HYPH|nr:hypothetical protein [Brucella grignonensis]NKB83744.1 hypothetical protein [Brucella grignonensis]OYR09212.1 hypothetical protein CEV33_2941 [Brucella grignonensis]